MYEENIVSQNKEKILLQTKNEELEKNKQRLEELNKEINRQSELEFVLGRTSSTFKDIQSRITVIVGRELINLEYDYENRKIGYKKYEEAKAKLEAEEQILVEERTKVLVEREKAFREYKELKAKEEARNSELVKNYVESQEKTKEINYLNSIISNEKQEVEDSIKQKIDSELSGLVDNYTSSEEILGTTNSRLSEIRNRLISIDSELIDLENLKAKRGIAAKEYNAQKNALLIEMEDLKEEQSEVSQKSNLAYQEVSKYNKLRIELLKETKESQSVKEDGSTQVNTEYNVMVEGYYKDEEGEVVPFIPIIGNLTKYSKLGVEVDGKFTPFIATGIAISRIIRDKSKVLYENAKAKEIAGYNNAKDRIGAIISIYGARGKEIYEEQIEKINAFCQDKKEKLNEKKKLFGFKEASENLKNKINTPEFKKKAKKAAAVVAIVAVLAGSIASCNHLIGNDLKTSEKDDDNIMNLGNQPEIHSSIEKDEPKIEVEQTAPIVDVTPEKPTPIVTNVEPTPEIKPVVEPTPIIEVEEKEKDDDRDKKHHGGNGGGGSVIPPVINVESIHFDKAATNVEIVQEFADKDKNASQAGTEHEFYTGNNGMVSVKDDSGVSVWDAENNILYTEDALNKSTSTSTDKEGDVTLTTTDGTLSELEKSGDVTTLVDDKIQEEAEEKADEINNIPEKDGTEITEEEAKQDVQEGTLSATDLSNAEKAAEAYINSLENNSNENYTVIDSQKTL